MAVKFWQTSLRFWFFLSYLITTVIENVYLIEKQNKGNFEIFFRRFKIRENMWWTIPKSGDFGNWVRTKSLTTVTLESGFSKDFTRCPIPMMYWFVFFISTTNSWGVLFASYAAENCTAASFRAPVEI